MVGIHEKKDLLGSAAIDKGHDEQIAAEETKHSKSGSAMRHRRTVTFALL